MSKRMMFLRLPDWIEQLVCFCVQKVQECYDGFDGIAKFAPTRVFDGSGESARTHEKFDQSTGEVHFAVGCRDDRPIVDSGSVVSTCPVDYVTSVPTEKVQYSMNLGSVLGESLQHYDIKRDVLFHQRNWQHHERQF